MKDKPITPYQRLLDDIKKWCSDVAYRHRVKMWTYQKARLSEGWELATLNQRVAAAGQLGYEVILESDDSGLHVLYRKKAPDVPLYWQY